MARTSIAAGASVTVSIPAGSRVEIIGGGTYEHRPSSASSRPTLVQNIAEAGSWVDASPTDGSVMIIADGGGATYEVSAASDVIDPAGNVSLTAQQVAAVAALVEPVGTVTVAALTATTGTPGQTIRIADGADAGAALVWAIPAGASAYTWCWWLWPQAAY